jgi:hypothetical protein
MWGVASKVSMHDCYKADGIMMRDPQYLQLDNYNSVRVLVSSVCRAIHRSFHCWAAQQTRKACILA